MEKLVFHVAFIVSGDAASDLGEEEFELGVRLGTFVKEFYAPVYIFICTQSKIFIQRGEGIALPGQAFANTHLRAERVVCLSCRSTVMFPRHVGAEYKYLVWVKGGYHSSRVLKFNSIYELNHFFNISQRNPVNWRTIKIHKIILILACPCEVSSL